jgi:Common central domain of tyrosinase/Polyphenol oxidase middle domain
MKNRKTYLKPVSWIATVVLLSACAASSRDQESPDNKSSVSAPQVRMRWQDFVSGPNGAKRLASLQAGIAKMKSLDKSPHDSADYRRSWEYWANIHGYYGPQSRDGTVADQLAFLASNGMSSYRSYYNGITDQAPPDAIAVNVWAKCEHSAPNQQAQNFFGWHRMYLYYFERVLRWAASDGTLRMPYWDYTDPQQELLPPEFRDKSSALYDAKRNPGINAGAAKLNSNSTNVDSFLTEPDYFTYELGIEENVHGYVHCTIGPRCPVAHMGDVPVASNDPIFYSHHANIDRLWACWQSNHKLPAGAWQDQPFSFVDETGTLQTQPVKNFLNSSTLGYVYDNVGKCTRAGGQIALNLTLEQAVAEGKPLQKNTLAAAKSVSIDHPLTMVDISIPASNIGLLAAPEGTVSTELVLRDVTADSYPGVLFDVYIAKKNKPDDRKFAGTISWFGVFRHHGTEGTATRTLEFPISRQLRELGDLSDTPLTVTFEATEGLVPTNPERAKSLQAEAAKDFRPEAKLRIGSIELQTKSLPQPGKNQ